MDERARELEGEEASGREGERERKLEGERKRGLEGDMFADVKGDDFVSSDENYNKQCLENGRGRGGGIKRLHGCQLISLPLTPSPLPFTPSPLPLTPLPAPSFHPFLLAAKMLCNMQMRLLAVGFHIFIFYAFLI